VTHVFAISALGLRASADSGVERHRDPAHPGCHLPMASCYRSAGAAFRGKSFRSSLSVGTALLLLSLLLTLYSRGLIGGGDVKIMTALAVGLSPFDCYRFIVATAIAGGLLGITYLVLSRRLPPIHRVRGASLLNRVAVLENRRIRRRGPLPYGVAVAAGGTFVLLRTGGS
jgi:Flp pilus assembly protein protease CpaA